MTKEKTTIPKLKYKDWFINLPKNAIPSEDDEEESEAFWENQKELCLRGCYIEDVFFSGFLYWHLNFWKTEVDVLTEDGMIIQEYINPYFRDNEWIIGNALQEAKKQRKGLIILGARRISKSVNISSYISHGAVLDAHSQNVFVGVNGDDIKVTTSKISKGLDNLPEGLRWMRIAEDWKKQVTLGIKMSGGQKVPFSEIMIRNLDNGNNEEAIAGTKPRTLVIEEALHEDELVRLQNGDWIPIKDVEVGDFIYGGDLKITKVLEKIDVGIRDIWSFTLSDGKTIRSCDKHQWEVLQDGKIFLTTTEDIRKYLDKVKIPVNTFEGGLVYRYIEKISPVGKARAFCIKVDNQNHLFLTTNSIVTHNCGKSSWLKGFQAAIPGFTTPYGWGCSPLVIGTSGDMENYHDAKTVFLNPSAYDFLEFDDPDNPHRKVGLFLGNKYRQDAKRKTTFGDYLKIENKKSDLYNIPFWESDEQLAEEILARDLEKRLKDPDKTGFFKESMYFPRTVDDIFLNINVNMYNIKACQAQQVRIKEQGITGTPVELYHDGMSVKWKTSLKDYITEWPIKNQNKDAPVIIYEMPVPDAPKFLYVAGIDSYIQDSSNTSDSLGTCYIFKRIHSLSGEGFQNTLVASYSARPDDQGDWEETVRLMLMFYNAYALVENDQPSFIKYMISKGSAEQYLAPEPKDLISSLIKKSNSSRRFGISRASKAVREHLNNVLKRYMEEVIHTTTHPETGEVLQETRGITRILDHTLLEELIGFSPIANCDRQVAASLAILMAQELDPLLGTAIGDQGNTRKKTLTQVLDNLPRKTFSGGGNPFSNKRKKSLFKR